MPCATGSSSRPARGWASSRSGASPRCLPRALPGVEPGERFYGYYPMASHLLVAPAQVRGSGFVDASEHRRNLPSVYNQYLRCSSDPLYRASDEALQMLLRPLFTTSFLLDDFLAEHAFFGATDLLLSSASSKTAIGLAFLLQRNRAQRGQDYRIVGLTSAGNRAFVEGLGCYDEVLAYDRLDALDASGDALSVDFAGNGALLGQLHQRLGDRLRYSCLVGAAHWDQRGGLPKALPGPTPKLFFAPAQAENASRIGAARRSRRAWRKSGASSRPSSAAGSRSATVSAAARCWRSTRTCWPGARHRNWATSFPSTAAEAAVLYCWTEVANPSRTTKRVPPMASAAPLRRRFAGDGEIPSMNRAKLYLCCVALLLVPAIAGAATADYVYGMPLDVARVLSVDEAPSDTCQVVRATLVYLDSHGERQVLHYLKQARACSDE